MKKSMIILVLINLVSGCREEPVGQTPVDSEAPAAVTNVTADSRPGGALIMYDLPDDEDLLYVKAVYELNEGKQSEVRASVYADSLKIEGFGDTEEKTVRLITVDRSKNESGPVSVTVKPGEPPIKGVKESLKITATFGGVDVAMKNTSGANIVICLEVKDENGDFITYDKIYTKQKEGKFEIRGMEAEKTDLRYYVTDPWDNVSDMDTITVVPLFEMRIPHDRIEPMASLSTTDAWWWPLANLFDENTGTGYHTEVGGGRVWPHHFIFNIADGPVMVSRVRVIQREGYEYQHGNPRKFTLYGSNGYPVSNSSDYSKWTKLGDFESVKPSGLPLGQNSDEDLQRAKGEDFNVGSTESYKYFRVDVTQSWSGIEFVAFMEFQLWGSPDGFEFPE